MLPFILRRLGYALLILLGVTLVTYLLLFLLPADPARQIAGRSATPEVVAAIRAQLGLDQPFYHQYLGYLGICCRATWAVPTFSAPRSANS